MTAWRRIQRTLFSDAGVGKLIILRKPPYSTILLLDGKHFQVGRKVHTLYVAFDGIKRRPICWLLLPHYELREGYDRLLSFLKRQQCRIDAVISDGHKGLAASVQGHYPLAIHQRCTAHVLREAYQKLGGRWFAATGTGQEIWPVMRKIALGFNNDIEARIYLKKMKRKYPDQRRAFFVLQRSLSDIYRFSYRPHLPIPRTSNLIENFMGFLEQRLKTFRGVKTPKSLIQIITSLIALKYKRPTKK